MAAENHLKTTTESPLRRAEAPEQSFVPKPLTATQNVILTLKIMGVAGILGLLLWLVGRSNT